MSLKKVCRKLHLWLGLISGLIVSIVAITGCIYAFEPEIRAITSPEQFVEIQNKPFLSPSQLKEKAVPYVYKSEVDSTNTIYGVTYATANKAVKLAYNHHKNGYSILLLNPYNGTYIGEKTLGNDFFRVVLAGHRNLWLPYPVGHQIVGWAVVLFVILILTGLILWFPREFNPKKLKAAFKIKWNTTSQRRNHDLHRVLGFYTALISLIIALTGLTWSFNWYGETYYKIISGGEELKKWEIAVSDTTLTSSTNENAVEQLWNKMKSEYPIGTKGSFSFDFPNKKADSFRVSFNPEDKTYYKSVNRFFDQTSLAELEGGGIYGILPDKQTNADKLYRMTYDIHVGAIGGLFGRILVFAVSLIIATLPITGFFILVKRKKKKKH